MTGTGGGEAGPSCLVAPSGAASAAAEATVGEGSVGPDLRRFCQMVGGDCGATTQQSEPTCPPLPGAIHRKPGGKGKAPMGGAADWRGTHTYDADELLEV